MQCRPCPAKSDEARKAHLQQRSATLKGDLRRIDKSISSNAATASPMPPNAAGTSVCIVDIDDV
jgi:hypothetical protein